MNKDDERINHFQHIVLALLWVIVLLCLGKKPHHLIVNARQDCIRFGDLYGNQNVGAENYRRDMTYWYPN